MPLRPVLGVLLLGGLWLGPLPLLASVSMTFAMILHLGAAILAPMLLAPAPGRARPPPSAVVGAGVVEAAAVWGWHAPAAHAWARFSTLGLALEQLSFVAAGTLLWWVAGAAGRLAGAALLLATTTHMALLGALIGLAPRQIYAACGGGPLGLTPLEDQQLAGALMAAGGGAAYMGAALVRLAPALDAGERR